MSAASDRDALLLAFGLLWHDRIDEARLHLSSVLSLDDRGRGIGMARAREIHTGERILPRPIERAIHMLDTAANELAWEDDDTGWVKYRAAAVTLDHWAIGVDDMVRHATEKKDD